MSNNYETVTMLSNLPAGTLREVHHLALEGCGFTAADAGGGSIFLYSVCLVSLDLDDEPKAVEALKAAEQTDPGSDEFRSWLLGELAEEMSPGWEVVLQAILQDLPESVTHFDLQGAYWGDKTRPGDFGGFAIRITRDRIQSFSTQEWLASLPPCSQLLNCDHQETPEPESTAESRAEAARPLPGPR